MTTQWVVVVWWTGDPEGSAGDVYQSADSRAEGCVACAWVCQQCPEAYAEVWTMEDAIAAGL